LEVIEMNKMGRIQGVVGLAVLGWAFGCGSSSGGSADFTALYAQYTKPTGTLAKSDLSSVTSALNKDETQKSIPVSGASLGFGRGLRTQDITENCTDGGSFDIGSLSSSSTGEEATITYSSCSYAAGESVSGTISFAEWTSPEEILIYSGTLDVTAGGKTDDVTLDFALVNGDYSWSVTLGSGGNVLVSESGSWDTSTSSGMFTVTDSTTTWTCTWNNGTGSCTGADGHSL
jgi:hypothetical protein